MIDIIEKEYNFLDYKVKIVKEENELYINFPLISKELEELNIMIKKIVPEKVISKEYTAFPLKGLNKLVKITDNIYIIKNSGGFTIETPKDSNNLIIRDPNFDIFSKKDLKNKLLVYSNYLEDLKYAQYEVNLKEKLNWLKSNAHSFSTIIETYSVDFNGKYAENTKELEKAAKGVNSYWQEIVNPFNEKIKYPVVDYNVYIKTKDKKIYAGYLVYQPIFIKTKKYTGFYKYKLYALDEKGIFFKERNGKDFFLSND